jgi:hypothetical protein
VLIDLVPYTYGQNQNAGGNAGRIEPATRATLTEAGRKTKVTPHEPSKIERDLDVIEEKELMRLLLPAWPVSASALRFAALLRG